MIYGYDDEKQVVNIAGYDITRHFEFHTLFYENYENAFQDILRQDFCNCFKRNNNGYDFDIGLVGELLYDFIHSKNTSERLRAVQNPRETDCICGIRKTL